MSMLISPAPFGWRNEEFAFGSTKHPYKPSRPHQGQDWGYFYSNYDRSRIIVAAHSGVVESVYSGGGNNNNWGNRIVIRVNSRVTITVNHLATGSILVQVGQYVTAGTQLGLMGTTGETYGEMHLHEEMYLDAVRVDPQYYRSHDIPGTDGSASGGGSTPLPTPQPTPSPEEGIMQFLITAEHVAGAGSSQGIDRWLVTVSSVDGNATKRAISSQKELMYESVGMPRIVGLQPKSYADEFPTVN